MTASVFVRRPLLLVPAAVVLAALTSASWFVWLGHQADDYAVVQVAACVVTLIVLALVAGVLLRPWLVVAVMPLSFTVTWSVDASRYDETGLWAVGAVMLFVGCLLGSAVLAGIASVVGRWTSRVTAE